MITIKPAEEYPLILTFDGTVLEVFRMSSSERMHVGLIESLELKTDKKGKHSLDIATAGSYSMQVNLVDDKALAQVNALIADIQKAKAAFKFDS